MVISLIKYQGILQIIQFLIFINCLIIISLLFKEFLDIFNILNLGNKFIKQMDLHFYI